MALNNEIEINSNQLWNETKKCSITVITPAYNRVDTIERTIKSVENQSFRDIEYIVIDDGSTDGTDSVVERYLKSFSFPFLYIKKSNGGVHTARNIGYRYARGELILCIDSDDELTRDACHIFWSTWTSIPFEKRREFWQMKALCVDETGNFTSDRFPDNINSLSIQESEKYFSKSKGEQIGCRVAEIMKCNLFPEPEGVKFVNECTIWIPLENKYRSYGINEVVRIYHKEGNERLSGTQKKSFQTCRNAMWNSANEINNKKLFIDNIGVYLSTLIRYCIMKNILKNCDIGFTEKYPLTHKWDLFMEKVMFVPSIIVSRIYKIRRMGK